MLIGGGGIMSGNALIEDELGFIGRGKVLARILQRGDGARLMDSNGQLDAMAAEAVDVDGTYIGRDGLVKKAVLNRLRFGQDGALVEGPRTNDTQSDGSAHALIQAGGTITRSVDTSDVTDPIGTNTATKFVFPFSEISSGQYLMVRYGPYSPSADAIEHLWVRGSAGGEQMYLFMLATPNDEKLITLTTSWQKVSLGGATATWILFGQDRRNANMSGALSDATIYTWAINVENEGLFSTSSIVNPDAPGVLRAADDIRYSNAGEAICKAAQGTAIVAITPEFNVADITAQARIFDVRPADNADGWTLLADDGSNSYKFKVRSGGATIADIDSSVVVPVKGRTDILAVSWKLNEYTLYANGAQEGQDTAGAVPTAMNTSLYLGQNNAAIQQWFGKINRGVFTEPVLSSRQVENATAVLRKAA